MKIIKNIKKEIEQEEITDILCNKCGESCKDKCNMNYEGLIEANVWGGYGSKLGDSVSYQFSLCEDCLKIMFDDFKIPVLKTYESY
jgi:hypothetical protein